MSTIPVALSVAGSDPSGGAGIQADLKAFEARGVYGMAVITALTAQNTRAVTGVHPVPGDFILAQLHAIFDDIPPGAVKVGMVGTRELAHAVATGLSDCTVPIVVDPVMVATSGAVLLEPDAEHALRTRVLPLATLITPNLPEAARLFGDTDPADWARTHDTAVLLKDGHNTQDTVTDRLFMPDGSDFAFAHPRVATRNTHGTGCTLSSAIAAELAHGHALPDACGRALTWLSERILASRHHTLGGGHGPLLHSAALP